MCWRKIKNSSKKSFPLLRTKNLSAVHFLTEEFVCDPRDITIAKNNHLLEGLSMSPSTEDPWEQDKSGEHAVNVFGSPKDLIVRGLLFPQRLQSTVTLFTLCREWRQKTFN